ncbi:hypothetical protein DT075_01640 [Bacillus licheniformis]|nr:hypothetical protein DT075_01640 [Bacillus licheniformis]
MGPGYIKDIHGPLPHIPLLPTGGVVAGALKAGGIRLVEITLNSPQAIKAIEAVSEHFGDEMLVGAGTVLDPESARAALLAGARFILSPTVKAVNGDIEGLPDRESLFAFMEQSDEEDVSR